MLHLLLADEYAFLKMTRNYQWNATGRDLPRLRLHLKLQHEKSAEWVDALAERIRELQFGANINWLELAASARCSFFAGEGLTADKMLSELLRLHDRLIAQLCSDTDTCLKQHEDPDTAGFLAGLSEQHENAAWLLRNQFQKG